MPEEKEELEGYRYPSFSSIELDILATLCEKGEPMTAYSLSNEINIKKNKVYYWLKQMLEKELVSKEELPNGDGHNYRVNKDKVSFSYEILTISMDGRQVVYPQPGDDIATFLYGALDFLKSQK